MSKEHSPQNVILEGELTASKELLNLMLDPDLDLAGAMKEQYGVTLSHYKGADSLGVAAIKLSVHLPTGLKKFSKACGFLKSAYDQASNCLKQGRAIEQDWLKKNLPNLKRWQTDAPTVEGPVIITNQPPTIICAEPDGIARTPTLASNNATPNTEPSQQNIVIFKTCSKEIATYTDGQHKYGEALKNTNIPILLVHGPAGTGKTTLAMAHAASQTSPFRANGLGDGQYKQIIILNPYVKTGADIGAIPGGKREKIEARVEPIIDCLKEVTGFSRDDIYKLSSTVIYRTPDDLEGLNFSDSFVLLDAVHNARLAQVEMLLSRFSKGSKFVLAGDVRQMAIRPSPDKPLGQQPAILHLEKIFEKRPEILLPVHLTAQDIVRSREVRAVVELFETYEAGTSFPKF